MIPVANALDRLRKVLSGFERLAVAVSGGVDSTTLAAVAHETLGRHARLLHARSPAVPAAATARLAMLAAERGWDLVTIDAGELDDPDYRANPADRCYFCKRDLYGAIRGAWDGPIASGTNCDDLADVRPGLVAAARHGVRHPLVEAGIDKAGVRALAREVGLDAVAELPSSPCLSSRIETGIEVTADRLHLIEAVELLVAGRLGASTVRARLRSDGLTLELGADLLEGARAIEGELGHAIAALQRRHGMAAGLRLAPYSRGSAFLREGGAPGQSA